MPVWQRVARVNKAGQVIRRFQVHGSKVRLCHLGRQLEDDRRSMAIWPGVLPDFPDSEISGPMYCLDEPQEDQLPRRGVAAEQHQQSRNQKQYQEWEGHRSHTRQTNHSKTSDKWEEVPYRQRKKFAKPSQSQPIRLERRECINLANLVTVV